MNCRASHNRPGAVCSMSPRIPIGWPAVASESAWPKVPATGGYLRPDPIAVLMGGPGEESIGAAEIYVRQFVLLHQDRDILLVDWRGAGRSGALQCDLISTGQPAANLIDLFLLAAVEECERRLRVQADLTQYTL